MIQNLRLFLIIFFIIGYSADGTLKLFDFGLSVCVKSSNKQEECYKMTGNTGTLRYMAPEVALGRPYNASVDIYSFSIIFHQILSNRVPFLRLGKKAFLKNVVENGQRPPLDPRWPIALQELLVKCWSADISVRVHSKSVQQELVNLVREESQRQFKRMDHSAMSTFRPSSINRSNNTIKFAFLVAFCVIFIVTLSFVIASSGLDVVAGSLLLISSSALYSIVLSYEPQLRRLRIFGGSLSPSLLRKATQTSKHVPVSSSEVSSTHSIDHNDPECGMSLTDTDSQKLNRNIKSQAVYGGSTFNPIVANTR